MHKNQNPPLGIKTPHPNDVLCGRGGHNIRYTHPGNVVFRSFVEIKRPLYCSSKKKDKPKIANAVVDAIHKRDPPGRFLERNMNDSLWYEIDRKRAVDKASQALRDKSKRGEKSEKAPLQQNRIDFEPSKVNEKVHRPISEQNLSHIIPEKVVSLSQVEKQQMFINSSKSDSLSLPASKKKRSSFLQDRSRRPRLKSIVNFFQHFLVENKKEQVGSASPFAPFQISNPEGKGYLEKASVASTDSKKANPSPKTSNKRRRSSNFMYLMKRGPFLNSGGSELPLGEETEEKLLNEFNADWEGFGKCTTVASPTDIVPKQDDDSKFDPCAMITQPDKVESGGELPALNRYSSVSSLRSLFRRMSSSLSASASLLRIDDEKYSNFEESRDKDSLWTNSSTDHDVASVLDFPLETASGIDMNRLK